MSQKRFDPFAAFNENSQTAQGQIGRTAGARQRQGRVPGGGSGQAASKHSSGETIRGRGRQKTIRSLLCNRIADSRYQIPE